MPREPPVTSATRAIRSSLVVVSRQSSVVNGRCAPLTNDDRPLTTLPLDAHRDAHAAADAERREALLGVAPAHLVEERDQDAGARGADRMTDGDCAAVDVHDLGVPAHVLVDRE